MTQEVELLQKIAHGVDQLNNRLTRVESAINEIEYEIHKVRPKYVEKLKLIESEGTISQDEFEREFGVKI